MKIENVLSLFDGMSCGRLALERAGIDVGQYYASEVDKYAITVTKANWPNTKHLGDVRAVSASDLPAIDLLIGGSPCQSFSFAGKRKGMTTKDNEKILTLEQYLQLKEQDFEFEGQSYLFWEYVRLLKDIKPKYFLLENVLMKKEWEQVISETLGVQPIMINSALVSAQNRKRLYWTNIPNIKQPKDKGILLKDIIEDVVPASYFCSEKLMARVDRKKYSQPKFNPDKTGTLNTKNNSGQASIDSGTSFVSCFVDREKSLCLDANYYKGGNLKQYFEKNRRQLVFGGAQRGRYNPDGTTSQQFEINGTYKANALTTVQKDSLCVLIGIADGINAHEERKRVYSVAGKSPTLQTPSGGYSEKKIAVDEIHWRKLTPIECERLQTVPDDYTAHVSNSQRYKMLGNGWTVDVIAHILSHIFTAASTTEQIAVGDNLTLFKEVTWKKPARPATTAAKTN